MSRSSGALIALAVLLAAGIALWLATTPAERETSGNLVESDEGGTNPDAPLLADPSLVQREGARTAPDDLEPATPRRPPEEPASAAAPLADSEFLRVRVVEAASGRRTAELAVCVRWVERSEYGTSSYGIFTGKPTGNEPEVRVPRRQIDARAAEAKGKGEIEIALAAPFDPPVQRSIEAAPWPSEPVELTVPPFGFVGFRLQDAGGHLIDASGQVQLARGTSSAFSGVERESFVLQRGVTEVTPCGLDMKLLVSGELEDSRKLEELRIDGPKSAHETLWIPLQLAATQALLVVRVLDPESRPLAKKRIEVCVHQVRGAGSSTSTSRSTRQYESDGEGRVRLPLEDPSGDANMRRVLAFAFESRQKPRWTALLDVSREIVAGETSLGDVVLAPEPLVASGRVLDARGEGIPGATVNAELLDPAGTVGLKHSEDTQADERGTFELRSTYPLERVRLTASANSYLSSPPVEHAPGTAEVTLRLERGASLRGSVKLPAGMEPSSVRVSARAALEKTPNTPEVSKNVEKDGSFALDGLAPGLATIAFRCGSTYVVGEVKDVELISGQECRDPRLQDLELCSDWHRLALRLFDGTRKPVAAQSVRLRHEESKQMRSLSTDAEGRIACWTPANELAWTLRAPERATARITWSKDEQEVLLGDGLRVVLPVEAVLIPPFSSLEVALTKADLPHGPSTRVADGIAEIVVPEPGRYRLRVSGIIRQGSSTMGKNLKLDPPYEVDIDVGGPKRLPPCRVPEEVIRAAAEAR